jgi:putative endonuclease
MHAADTRTERSAMPQYYVYVLTNRSRTLCVGMTNDIRRRVWQHKHKLIEGFTKRYNITHLVADEASSTTRRHPT